ncbi:hypothetical protein SARC_12002 [Sphaeroforma arctica JP610]|uniref:Uncharacterized protein n=1 Tax=Sphaeroforma arctica JP610 TaxID=667725 RepID=A0A0L0FFC3_9EUKA|nr:hypothetical protein SARC_12002 [Sphaeroforma arctica JP610]KNC75474.1 hypothetical protein SARC_12002 [Sphaeroforma arctica JP610]|eukprot:XP_014149376.1 hypothetical protein SARC_12002 [Sphaeroforma arctica JP610]
MLSRHLPIIQYSNLHTHITNLDPTSIQPLYFSHLSTSLRVSFCVFCQHTGMTFGGLYAYSSYLISSNEEIGHDLAAAASAALTLSMGRRAVRSGKFMPAGLVTGLALVAGGYNGYKAMDYRGMI